MDINQRIKNIRKHLMMTQEQFGDSIGLSQVVISKIETPGGNVNERTLQLISYKHNVNPEYLKNGKGEMFLKKKESVVEDIPGTVELIERMRADHQNEKNELYKIITDFRQMNQDYRQMLVKNKVLPG